MKLARLVAFFVCPAVVVSLPAQTFTDPANLRGERVSARDGRELPIDQGARGLEQMLRKLTTRASLMLIVAHPDDEDGGMLTFNSRGLGARVADLSLTRGEGGQNAMTGDFGDALGLLRTQELLASDRYTGVDQFFGTEVDFGFSKTKQEAFSKWKHERVLYDAVRAVRLYRPLVIVAMWVGGVTDGHGQHQVSGQIAQEVFKAAGDPRVFPEMIAEGIEPWQPLKVYARVPSQSITPRGLYDYATGQYTSPRFVNYVTGEVTTTVPSADVVVHEGQVDPLLSDDPATPRSFVQFARLGLALQKSQIGPGFRAAPTGAFDVPYHRYGSVMTEQPTQEASFFDGIDTSVAGIASLAPHALPALRGKLTLFETMLQRLSGTRLPDNISRVVPQLAEALSKLDNIITEAEATSEATPENVLERENALHELRIKRRQLNDTLVLALGATLDATAASSSLPTATATKFVARLETHSTYDLQVTRLAVVTASGGQSAAPAEQRIARPLTADHAQQQTLTLPASETLNETRPYFRRASVEDPVYALTTPALRNSPSGAPALVVAGSFEYRGVPLEIDRVIHAGDQPAVFVPQVSVMVSSRALAYVAAEHTARIDAAVTFPGGAAARGTLSATTTGGWTVKPQSQPLESGLRSFGVSAPSAVIPAMIDLRARLANGSHIDDGFRAVGYAGLPGTNLYVPAAVRTRPVDLTLPAARRIAYLPGTGDAVPEALRTVGLVPTLLSVADLTAQGLQRFDTVVLGVRTYNAHPDLHGAPTQALLDFARRGGNVVVQYQTPEFTGADAPYPLSLGSNEKVVDERAPVRLVDTKAALLRSPNLITEADFNGWVEERGHGFLGSWDDHYTALTETHDPGAPEEFVKPQEPQRGGLITVKLGEGRWTYCAFALYRQLPEAIPGAFRLFANLLSR